MQISQIGILVEWLQQTPKITSIRVNLLRISSENVMNNILKTFTDWEYLPICPKVQIFQPIPEILLIENTDETFVNCRPNEQFKEIIVDVSCGVAVLRGKIQKKL